MEKRTITVHFAKWDSYECRPKEFFSLRVWELLTIKDIQNDIFRDTNIPPEKQVFVLNNRVQDVNVALCALEKSPRPIIVGTKDDEAFLPIYPKPGIVCDVAIPGAGIPNHNGLFTWTFSPPRDDISELKRRVYEVCSLDPQMQRVTVNDEICPNDAKLIASTRYTVHSLKNILNRPSHAFPDLPLGKLGIARSNVHPTIKMLTDNVTTGYGTQAYFGSLDSSRVAIPDEAGIPTQDDASELDILKALRTLSDRAIKKHEETAALHTARLEHHRGDLIELTELRYQNEVTKKRNEVLIRETSEMQDALVSVKIQLESKTKKLANIRKKFAEYRSKDTEEKECAICMDAPPNCAFVPCGHKAVCHTCAPQLKKCPICNGPAQSTLRIFEC